MNQFAMDRRGLLLSALGTLGTLATLPVASVVATENRQIFFVSDDKYTDAVKYERLRTFWGGEENERGHRIRVVRVNTIVGNMDAFSDVLREIAARAPVAVVVSGDSEALAVRERFPLLDMIFGINVDPFETDLLLPGADGVVRAAGYGFDHVSYLRPVEVACALAEQVDRSSPIAVLAATDWYSRNRQKLWHACAARYGRQLLVRLHNHSTPVDTALRQLQETGAAVCVTPNSWLTVLHGEALSSGLKSLHVLQIAERFDQLPQGAPIAYEDTFTDWVPMMGQMVRMYIEGEALVNIPTRRPDTWQWGVNRAALQHFGLQSSALPLAEEVVVSLEL
jgi:hypothetical protein